MPTEQKRETVAELRDELSRSRTLIVSEYRGLTVREMAEIRRALDKSDIRYRIVKNRLMRIAAGDGVGEALAPLLSGPTAIAFGNDEAGAAQGRLDPPPAHKGRPGTRGARGDRALDAHGVY